MKPTRRTRKPNTDPALAVAYVRVSTDEQQLGPEAQRAAIEAWAAGRGIRIVAWCEDLGVSGGARIEKCTGLLAALEALEAHAAGTLIVHKRDRLARDLVKAAAIEALAERHGANVVTTEGDESGAGDPNAWLLKSLKDMFATYERLVIGARTRAALAVKKNRGERVGQVPYGYRVADDGRRLEVDPNEQAVIARVRALRADGLTLDRIAAALEAELGGRWYPMRVSRILRAPVAEATT